MIAKASRSLATQVDVPDLVEPEEPRGRTSLLQVLWRRRWVLLCTTLLALAGAGVYLVVATPVYTASSNVYIEQANVKIMTDSQGFMTKSDSFLYTQAEIVKSAPILSDALDKVDYRRMKTFEKVDNPVAWLQLEKDFKVEVGKKDDVVTVSLDSPYPKEAAEVVNAVVDAYMTAQGARKKTTAREMLKVLMKEKENRYVELSDKIKAVLKYKEENGALSFQDDRGNIILQRLAKLSDSLTTLEQQRQQLEAQYEAGKVMLQDPTTIRAFVQDLQTKATTGGDKDYEETRSNLLKYQLNMVTVAEVQGRNSEIYKTMKANISALETALERKERLIAAQWVKQLEQQLAAARAAEDKCRASFTACQKDALELNAKQSEFARLQEEVARTEKQCGDLDNRIKEITVNSADTGALNIQVLEAARPEDKPTKPRKAMTMAAALVLGLLLGSGLSLLWDWVDQRIRTPDEVSDLLGVAILGVVPQMPGRKAAPLRGQNVHLEPRGIVAEAYRTIRTGVHFGAGEGARTILVTSPAPGDGKSTTASNLAIALAQSGLRTLILDADLRKPTQHKIFQVDAKEGVTDVMQGLKRLRDVIHTTSIPRLDVLPCGPIPANPSEIIAGNRFAQVVAALAGAYDRVVIDSPPVIAVTDARILASITDTTILVLRTNRSTRRGSQVAMEALLSTGARVVGTIVNAMPQQAGLYAYYGRYGSYKYAYAGEQPQAPAPGADPAEAALGRLNEEVLALPGGSDQSADDAVALS